MYLQHDRGPSLGLRFCLLTVVLLIGPVLASNNNHQSHLSQQKQGVSTVPAECLPPPTWTVNGGRNLMKESKGNVTVVALLAASCPFCIRQAFLLTGLKDELDQQGVTANYMIVNEDTPMSKVLVWKLTSAARGIIPVYQEKRASEPVWDSLNGIKDDFFIYDKCGRLTFQLSLPMSKLTHPNQYVKKAIELTFSADPCGECDVQKGKQTQLDDIEEEDGSVLFQQQIELDIGSPKISPPHQQQTPTFPPIDDDTTTQINQETQEPISRKLDDMEEDPVFSDFTGDSQQEFRFPAAGSLVTAYINPRLDQVEAEKDSSEEEKGGTPTVQPETGFPTVGTQQIHNFMDGWLQMVDVPPQPNEIQNAESSNTDLAQTDQKILETAKYPVFVQAEAEEKAKEAKPAVAADWQLPTDSPVLDSKDTILAAVGEIRANDNLIDTEGKAMDKNSFVFSSKPFHLPSRARWLRRRRPYLDYPIRSGHSSWYPYYWRLPSTPTSDELASNRKESIKTNVSDRKSSQKPNWSGWKDSDDDLWSQPHEKPIWVTDIHGKDVKMHKSYADFQRSLHRRMMQPTWFTMTPKSAVDTDTNILTAEPAAPFPSFPEENENNNEEGRISQPSGLVDIPVIPLFTEVSTVTPTIGPEDETQEKPLKKWQLKKMRAASQVKKTKTAIKVQGKPFVAVDDQEHSLTYVKYGKTSGKNPEKSKNHLDPDPTFQKI